MTDPATLKLAENIGAALGTDYFLMKEQLTADEQDILYYDASPRPHLRFSVRAVQHGAAHGAALLQQLHCGGRGAQFDAEIDSRAQQPSDQGQSVAQLHTASVQGEIDQVPPDPILRHGRRRAAIGSRS